MPGAGWRYLRAGQTVTFDAESADQDGFAFRATRVWNVEVHGAAAAGQPDVAAPETKSTESTSSAWDIGSDGTVTEVE
ncbi:hypothetical protein NS14008_24065 [Nocardia seriolae]|nr:hypothetical protein NS14008_24065 [Nocardia seriolae]